MESQVRGGTRWKRFALIMVPCVAASAAIGVGIGQGALAASFAVSGNEAKVSAEHLEGDGFLQYGSLAVGAKSGTDGATTAHPVAVSSFESAKIYKMCQSVTTDVFGTPITLRLDAGGNGDPVTAKDLYIDVSTLEADATFTNIDIGIGLNAKTKGPNVRADDKVQKYGFAQQADKAVLDNVKQKAWATTASTFVLKGLKMGLAFGTANECYAG